MRAAGDSEDFHPFFTEFPRRDAPPPVPNYQGPNYMDARVPIYRMDLDAGAFRAVWELLEAETKHRYPTKKIMHATQACCRALIEFRRVFWMQNVHEEPKKPTGKVSRIQQEKPRRKNPEKAGAPMQKTSVRIIKPKAGKSQQPARKIIKIKRP
jgi:hypothetical protein